MTHVGRISTGLICVWTLIFSLKANAQDCDCASDFQFLAAKLATAYSGYGTKVHAGNRRSLDSLTKQVAVQVINAGEEQCDSLLAEWLTFFRDG